MRSTPHASDSFDDSGDGVHFCPLILVSTDVSNTTGTRASSVGNTFDLMIIICKVPVVQAVTTWPSHR